MKETGITNAASVVLLVAILYFPCLTVSANRRSSSSPLSSTGFHDPYKFAYAVKKPLPFHANFGQTQLSVESTTADVYNKRERAPKKKPALSDSVKSTLEEEISLDESSFGDRIVPRLPTGRQIPKKTSKQQPSQQIVDTQSSRNKEKEQELNKEIDQFFSTFSAPQQAPVTAPVRPKESNVETTPQNNEQPEIVEPAVRPRESRKRVKSPVNIETPAAEPEDSNSGNEYAESIQNQYVSLPSNINSNQELQVEHKGIDSPETPAIVHTESNSSPGLEYSYFVFGSSSTPQEFADKLRDTPVPSIEAELAGKEVGSPGSVSSSIDDLFNKFSPFSQQEDYRSPSVSSPPSVTENTADRPFTAPKEIEPPSFSFSSAPFVPPASPEPPPFIPSPPVSSGGQSFSAPRYPSPPEPIREFTPPSVFPSTSGSIEPFPKPRFPEPTKFAGFIPSGLGGSGDSFTQFPKPNFAAFYPPLSTETVYYGGQPNEPPTHPILQNNVINFIKSNAGASNTLSPPATFRPQYPINNNNIGNPPAFNNIQNNFVELQNGKTRSPSPPSPVSNQPLRPPPPLNNQPLRPPPINSVGAAAPKPNIPPPPKPSGQIAQNSPKPVGFNPNLAALPPSSTISGQSITGVKYWSDPATPVRVPAGVLTAPAQKQNTPSLAVNPTFTGPTNPTPSSPFTAAKPSGFVASPALSTRPLSAPTAPKVTRPQQFSQLLPSTSGKSPVQPGKPGAFAGFSDFTPFTPVRNPSVPVSSLKPTRSAVPVAAPRPYTSSAFSPQINQVLPSLTRNPAPVPILAPMPVYLRPASLTLPKQAATRQVSKSYSAPLAKPIYYHAVVTYG